MPATATTAAPIAPEDGLVELPVPGAPSLWLWARTCSEAGCDCRNALLVSAGEDRAAVLSAAALAHAAWESGASYRDIAGKVGDTVAAFALDLDTAVPAPLLGAPDADPARDPRVAALLARLDGEALDELGRLWYRGKGWPDPELQRKQAGEFLLENWSPGDLVAWNDLLTGLRQDLYSDDQRVYEAADLYCIKPGCTCDEVVITFEPIAPKSAHLPGRVRVHRTGEVALEPSQRGAALLDRLWAQFRARHPRYLQRLTARDATMKDMGTRVVPRPARPAAAKAPPRNAPCPCGSGKKYKKCCGLTAA